MPYLLDGSTIRKPHEVEEVNSTQMVENRTLQGSITRDHFGDNKRKWVLRYRNTKPSDYTTIHDIYASYLSLGTAKSFQITESNYTVAATTVHVDLQQRGFSVGGTDYISDFDLVLTEA